MSSDSTPDWKSTLFLPKTDFPMRAGLPKREPGWLERWEKIGIYDRLREKAVKAMEDDAPRKPFTLHDGPPYANGHLHIGHGLNKTLKDIIVRSHQMMGRDARYIPGWDCHGLPIEWKIEEQYRAKGKNKDEVPLNELRGECRRFAENWVNIQRDEFKRLGIQGNWAEPYLTMNYQAEAVIAEEFMKFVMNGTVYRGSKPVMWSVVEKTALAEAEVEYHDHQSHTIWVKFPVTSVGAQGETAPEDLLDADVVIWTTTPWTIPQNRAVAFNPALSYGLYRCTSAPEDNWVVAGDLLVLGDALAEDVFAKSRAEGYERVRDVTAAELELITCAHPFAGAEGANGEWDYDVPMLPGDHVTDDAGTGFVHTAPSHGADDYVLGLKHGLPMTYNVLEDGSFRADLPFFAGAVIFTHKGKEGDANKRVIEKLQELGALAARGRIKHSYPHSWRSKAPLIFRNTPQWFAAIDKPLDDGMGEHGDTIRARALTSIDTLVKFTPETGRNRLRAMMETRPDWVLSRQRAWGVPLTCFMRETGPGEVEVLKNEEVNARISEAFRAEGADAWFEDGAKERFLNGVDGVNPEEWTKVDDILDVWFDSGSTHAFVLRDRADGTEDGLADLYLEGTDQHRGWFHSSMLQACGTIGRAPYRGVLTHGFTLDEKGQKMSKSLGNTIAPADIVKQYGADILRLWVSQTDYTGDQRIGPEILKGVADSYRRLRNTFRYMIGALDGYSEDEAVAPADMPLLERFILHRLAELDEAVRDGYAAYDFQKVQSRLFNFCTTDLSAFFFDARKDALYCDAEGALRRRATRTVMHALFERLVTWYAPILPFTMEDAWLERHPGEESSVHLQDFPETPREWLATDLAEAWAGARRVRSVVTGALEIERREKRVGASLEAHPTLWLDPQGPEFAKFFLVEELGAAAFGDLCITSGLKIAHGPGPEGAFRLDDVPGVAVEPLAAEGEKCGRCWKVLPEVTAEGGLCGRCSDAVG
ncbi:isoleucine--tRNA ligase [Rhodovulum sp. DZ06]|uniref:isoleucine--tRNA ligase n=1 Tax=Rhodovulum sp. DZ06 TaxID=3425126 RepID=UPI003D33051E